MSPLTPSSSTPERHLEALDAGVVLRAVRKRLEVRQVVVAAGNDDVRLHRLELIRSSLRGLSFSNCSRVAALSALSMCVL